MVIWLPVRFGQDPEKGFSCRVIETVSVGNPQSIIVSIRCLTLAAVSDFVVQMGSSTASTSAEVISSTYAFPMTGKA